MMNSSTMQHHTFDITVSAAGTPHEYLLSAQSSTQGEANGRTTINIGAAQLAELLAQLESDNTTPANLQALGATLYQSLFVGEIGMLLNRALGETIGNDDLGLRLRLRLNPPELAALPWEYLYSPERRLFLAASVETPLSRYLNLTEPIRQLAAPAQINLLVVMPQNSGLDIVAERKMLETIAAKLRSKMHIDFLEGQATQKAIREVLRQKEYHILHYAGHGAFKREVGSSGAVIRRKLFSAEPRAQAQQDPSGMTDEAFIYLDHAEKFTEPISAEQFAHFFTDYAFTRLVFLNACQGATRSSQQALVGLAPQLVLRGVPAVVAMQNKIDNDDAILFATEFYAELCNARDGGQVEVAISRARKALLQEKPNSAVFGNPVLYLRAEEGRLWEEKTPMAASPGSAERAKTKKKKSLMETWQAWVAFISAIVVLLGAISDLPKKFIEFYQTLSCSSPETEFCGRVVDARGNRVPDAEVIVQGRKGHGRTDENGEFCFPVKEKAGSTVQVIIKKDGRELYNGRETLPGGNPIMLKELP